jgi:hypothetical protein
LTFFFTKKLYLQFEIDTKNLIGYGNYLDKKIKIKQLFVIYEPYELPEYVKERALSEELLNIRFYTKKIKSKAYTLK